MTIYDKELSLKQDRVAATPDMRAQRAAILDELALSKGEHVLDVGSGNGRFVQEMSVVVGETGNVVGVDAAPAMVPLAQVAFPDREFHLADTTSLPFEDAVFNALTSAQVLSYVEDIQTGLSELFRVLKPGGRLVVLDTDWHSIDWQHPDPELMKRAIDLALSVYANAWLSDTLAAKLNKAGFENIKTSFHTITNTDPGPDTYSGMFIDFIEPAMRKSAKFSYADADGWTNGLRELSADGTYKFTVNRTIFSAQKPD